MARAATSGTAVALESEAVAQRHRLRLSVKVGLRTITATLTGYAYETIPEKPIIAGTSGPQNDAACPNYYCHDFGSILNFIEHTFGLGTINGDTYDYADSLVMDTNQTYTYSLADFFNYNQTQRQPTYIGGANHHTDCYRDPLKAIGSGNTKDPCFPKYPSDPDNDGIE